jgi:hypothetical protein
MAVREQVLLIIFVRKATLPKMVKAMEPVVVAEMGMAVLPNQVAAGIVKSHTVFSMLLFNKQMPRSRRPMFSLTISGSIAPMEIQQLQAQPIKVIRLRKTAAMQWWYQMNFVQILLHVWM